MIKFEEALKIVEESAVLTGTERLGFMESMNRVLAEDVKSDMQMPPFNKSAVDGYACRKEDLAEKLEVIEMIKAGQAPQKSVGVKQCSKIMTGAPVPEGADAVIMVEDVDELEKGFVRYKKIKSKIIFVPLVRT